MGNYAPPFTGAAAGLPVVCVQGLGFVGAAMAAAVAQARDHDGRPCFVVIGVDLPSAAGKARAEAVLDGRFPFSTSDAALGHAVSEAVARGNLTATTSEEAYAFADIAIVDVHLDVDFEHDVVDFAGLRKAIRSIASRMAPGGLIIVETTVPPGTCRNVVAPEIADCLTERGLPADAIGLAHSYERVMPGPEYLDSIINYWRVYAGHTEASAVRCQAFLEKVVNTADYPLTRLSDTTASEMAKVLENTYRAVSIALMDEWGRFAEAANVDMFEIVRAVRMRPTHNNIRQPGFGVGGYCLTKDPLFAPISMRQVLRHGDVEFPLSKLAVAINRDMPLHALNKLRAQLDGKLDGRRVLLLGLAYRSEVDDTRYSPSEIFYRALLEENAVVDCHDPYVRHWLEIGIPVDGEMPDPDGYDAIVLAVGHSAYQSFDFAGWLKGGCPVFLDANAVLTAAQQQSLREKGVRVVSVGRGGVS